MSESTTAQVDTANEAANGITVGVDAKLPWGKALLLGLQHVLAMDSYMPLFIIATALALAPTASTALIQSTFLGAGEAALLSLAPVPGVRRGRQSGDALLLTVCAQGGALLLTLLCSAAEIFPARLLAAMALGAALGALAAEQCKERGALHRGMRAALLIYGFFAVLACAEQALP